MHRYALLFVMLISGCAVTDDVDRTLRATAIAERRLGKSGALALEGVATLTTSLSTTAAHISSAVDNLSGVIAEARPAAKELAGVFADLHSTTSSLRQKIEDTDTIRKLLYGLVAAVSGLGAHAVVAHARTKKRINAVHDEVRAMKNPAK